MCPKLLQTYFCHAFSWTLLSFLLVITLLMQDGEMRNKGYLKGYYYRIPPGL